MSKAKTSWFLAAVAVAAVIACSGASGNGLGPGSALCGVSGNDQCRGNQKCDALLGCVECEQRTDCAEPRPICVSSLGQCAECGANSDCAAASPSCWPADHKCHVGCTTANAPNVCPRTAPNCDPTGACIGCNGDNPCTGDSKVCNPTTQQCVACAVDSDCPPGAPQCFATTGRCVACLDNGHCGAARPICNPRTFTCIPGCTDSTQCSGATPVCNTNESTCVECVANPDCAMQPGKLCGTDGVCVACLANADCPSSTPVCNAGACVQCLRSTDCPSGQVCFPLLDVCR